MRSLLRFLGMGIAIGLFALLAYSGYQQFAMNGRSVGTVGGPFALTDQNGRAVTDRDFLGRWLIIYFGYTHCPDACPTALNNIGVALDQLGAKRAKVTPIFITIDPARDTPKIMKDYVASFGNEFVGLTGSENAVAAAEQAYHVYAQKHPNPDGSYDMDHSSVLYVVDPNGHFVTNFTDETEPDQIATQLTKLID